MIDDVQVTVQKNESLNHCHRCGKLLDRESVPVIKEKGIGRIDRQFLVYHIRCIPPRDFHRLVRTHAGDGAFIPEKSA